MWDGGCMVTEALLEPKAVGDVIGHFYVPAYQRGYRWGLDEVKRLLDDIRQSEGSAYYLQPVVVKPMEDGRWELVDGQQRFTTLYLIFQFMKDQGLQSQGANFTLEYQTRPGSQQFLESPTEDGRETNIDFYHIYGAFEQIKRWFDAFEHRKQLEANKLYEALFERVKVIWYEASPDLNSVELFTRLNVGRIPLTDAELVKALVLARSAARPGQSDKSEQIAAQWDAFERELRAPELWSFVTARYEAEATHIGLLLDTLADRLGTLPTSRQRPRYFTFETLRPRIEADPQAFWDEIVALHSLVVGWYEDRDIFHKVGYLIALGDTFGALESNARSLTKAALHEMLDERIRSVLQLDAAGIANLEYGQSRKCTEVLLLMNVETVRKRTNTFERYSFNAHARGAWSLEHIHAQNAGEMKRDEKVWAEWLRLQKKALANLPGVDATLIAEIDEVLAAIDDERVRNAGPLFDAVKPKAEAALSERSSSEVESIHLLSNLALLDSGINSALSNSAFEVKREVIIQRDIDGAYIPACTRNVFLKYYTDSDSQQFHFWGTADRTAYLGAMLAAVGPFLLKSEVIA
jgi:hypothetical protein